jgi:transposase
VPCNDGFKARMIQRMTGPEGISATALSSQVGVSQPTLSRWVRERSLGGMNDEKPSKRRTWTAAEKFRVVQEASQLADGDLGGLL